MFVIVSGGWFSNSMDGEESNILDVDIEFIFDYVVNFIGTVFTLLFRNVENLRFSLLV